MEQPRDYVAEVREAKKRHKDTVSDAFWAGTFVGFFGLILIGLMIYLVI